ncbi:MAG TPA: hypothetical protein VG317_05190 [Pseudonocardiaceae bacterium]|nr:hypothetical protein [Pseudonocardiaceae bacterium]
MDEQKLADLFRAAAGDPPPASFDERDIAAASRDADQRHRRTVRTWGAVAASVVVLAGLGIGIGTVAHGGGSGAANSAGSPATAHPFDTGQPGTAHPLGRQPAVTGGENACGTTDPSLATALADALPAASRFGPAAVRLPCPADARSAGYQVRDGAATGVFLVVLTPGTEPLSTTTLPANAVRDTETTASGGRLAVLSEPAAGSALAPFTNLVAPIARQLAASH